MKKVIKKVLLYISTIPFIIVAIIGLVLEGILWVIEKFLTQYDKLVDILK